jgi:ABC-type uncharacterized transport system fused permease/ATPase subunit
MMGVTSLGIWFFIECFVFYIISHVILGIIVMQYKKRVYEKIQKEDETLKTLWFLNKWWPAIYLIFLLVIMYGIK